MDHSFVEQKDSIAVKYLWKVRSDWNFLAVNAAIEKQPIQPESEEEFITEHYWGYTKVNRKKTSAYEVRHPKWNIHPVKSFAYKCSICDLYGQQFEETLQRAPTSVFLADGSEISVMNNTILS
jgi:hypothetical protein